MRARFFIPILLMVPLAVRANPVAVDGQSLIAFTIVAFWALAIESGIVTLALVSCGVLIMPSFITLILANVAVFLFAFLPLTNHLSLWILEPGVVIADALAVKLSIRAFPSERFFLGGELAPSLGGLALGQCSVIFHRHVRESCAMDCA